MCPQRIDRNFNYATTVIMHMHRVHDLRVNLELANVMNLHILFGWDLHVS